MKRLIAITLFALASIGLSACASLSPEECRVADWQQIGYFDAADGREKSRLDDHRRACAEAGIVPDLNAYLDGYARGLPDYCTKAKGFSLGKSNYSFAAQCDRPEFSDFRDGFGKGQKVYRLQSDARQFEKEATEARQVIEDLSAQITANDQRLQDPALTEDQRDQIRRTNRTLQTLITEKREKETSLTQRAKRLREDANAIQP